ncbi:MAG: hypothetical protein QOD93_6696 [Acetobacteraceae bacterium]|jgi:hypothetical protein|nr:hypothetical protein [Acetobacteraceae bacterium]
MGGINPPFSLSLAVAPRKRLGKGAFRTMPKVTEMVFVWPPCVARCPRRHRSVEELFRTHRLDKGGHRLSCRTASRRPTPLGLCITKVSNGEVDLRRGAIKSGDPVDDLCLQ